MQLTGQCCVKHVVLGADEVLGLVTGLRIPLPRCPATDISQCIAAPESFTRSGQARRDKVRLYSSRATDLSQCAQCLG